MTDDELIEVLRDTEDGLSPAVGYGPAIEHVRALIAERDRLRDPFADLGTQHGCPDCGVHANCAKVVEEREQWKLVARVMESARDRMRTERDRVLELAEQITAAGEAFQLSDRFDMPTSTVEEVFDQATAAARRLQRELHEESDERAPKWASSDRRVVPDEELLGQEWFVVPDVLIGGWCATNTDKPDNAEVDYDAGERQLGDFLTHGIAEHIVELHNSWRSTGAAGGPHALPMYAQIVGWLRDRVRTGVLAPGDLVPSEREISEQWQCARATATKALDILRREGVIYSEPGRGTFVGTPRGEELE